MAIGMGILAFYYVNLSRDVIGVTKIANQFPPVSTGMADLMILAATAIWIYGTDVLRRLSGVCESALLDLPGDHSVSCIFPRGTLLEPVG